MRLPEKQLDATLLTQAEHSVTDHTGLAGVGKAFYAEGSYSPGSPLTVLIPGGMLINNGDQIVAEAFIDVADSNTTGEGSGGLAISSSTGSGFTTNAITLTYDFDGSDEDRAHFRVVITRLADYEPTNNVETIVWSGMGMSVVNGGLPRLAIQTPQSSDQVDWADDLEIQIFGVSVTGSGSLSVRITPAAS